MSVDKDKDDHATHPVRNGLGIVLNVVLSGLYGYFVFFVVGATGMRFDVDTGWADYMIMSNGPFDANTIFGRAYWIMMAAMAIWGYLSLQIGKKRLWAGLSMSLLVPGVCILLSWQQVTSVSWLGRFGLTALIVFALLYAWRMHAAGQKFRVETDDPAAA